MQLFLTSKIIRTVIWWQKRNEKMRANKTYRIITCSHWIVEWLRFEWSSGRDLSKLSKMLRVSVFGWDGVIFVHCSLYVAECCFVALGWCWTVLTQHQGFLLPFNMFLGVSRKLVILLGYWAQAVQCHVQQLK